MKTCKHKWKVVHVREENNWFEKLLSGIFASERTIVTLCCEKCGEVKYSK